MSEPPISSTSTTQPPIPVVSTSESMSLAAQAMTSSSIASTSTVSSASQFSAETLLAMLERPSTSLSQAVDVVTETPDLEVILPSEGPTVATRPFVHLCDPTAVTLPLHSTPLEPPSSHEIYLFVLGLNTFHRFLVILLAHLFCHHSSINPHQPSRTLHH